ncbi:hypothetical protein EI555_012419 [Monodon monoceros]|nr:hypothetical protein EI555_012419 [Monodon monoceros]
MTEPSFSPSKRRDGGDTDAPDGAEREGRGLGTGEPPLPLRSRGPGEGRWRADSLRGDWWAKPSQLNEEFCQYNNFQCWRNPLPPIDLSDIEGASDDNPTKTLPGKNEVVEINMES